MAKSSIGAIYRIDITAQVISGDFRHGGSCDRAWASTSLTNVTVTTTRGSGGRSSERPSEAQVEYRLVRNAVVSDVRRGRIPAVDVCDAHPELLRAARNVGKPTTEPCPICEDTETVQVTYVFGAGLPPGGRCPGSARELSQLRRRTQPVLCYDVEVCPLCAWHHLTRKYPSGGTATRRSG